MSMHVIHIEDEGPLRDILKIALRAAEPNLTLLQFVDGESARASLEQDSQKTDLFVLDIRLPGSLNGLQIAQLIRELKCPGYIVLTSAYGSPDKALLTSLDCEYLAKPWHIPDLVEKFPRYKLANRTTAQIQTLFPALKPVVVEPPTSEKAQTALVSDKKDGLCACSNCGQNFSLTSLVCPKCGSKVETVETLKLPIAEKQQSNQPLSSPTQRLGGVFAVGPQTVVLEIEGQKLTLPPQEKVLIGRRISAGVDSQLDVDLSCFKANSLGVARRHLQITRRDTLVYATDLGTLNGTWLNNRSLTSYSERLLRNGDELRLGQLKMRVWLG